MAKKAFNPVEYKNDFVQLAQSAPQDAADVAIKWRERFMNQAQEMQKSTEQIAEIGIAGVTAFVLSVANGGWEAQRDAMIAQWEEEGHVDAEADLETYPTPFTHPEGEKNPMKLFGIVDKTLVATLLLGTAAALNIAKKYTPLVRAAALGSGATWASNLGRDIGYKRTKEKLAAEAEVVAA